MSSYEDPNWSEVLPDDSPLERSREEAELRDWEAELLADRLGRDDPIREVGA